MAFERDSPLMTRSAARDSVLARAVRILETFTPDEPALSVSEIARRSQLHVATASRLIATLVGYGLLARRPDGRVAVGVRLWELALRASPTLGLRDAAMPFLEDVHAVVGHHVQLGVLDGSEVLFVERLSAPGAVVNYTRIAGRMPLHASSSGVVLLAYGSRDLQERVLAGPLERLTPHTVADPARLRGLLADVRRTGAAVLPGHVHDEAAGVAVPVRDRQGAVIAALSAIVPNDGRAHERVPVLQAAALGIGRALATPHLRTPDGPSLTG
jgi:DNA-binding IclR family transcriptional regulator